jgi:hypothetical protein
MARYRRTFRILVNGLVVLSMLLGGLPASNVLAGSAALEATDSGLPQAEQLQSSADANSSAVVVKEAAFPYTGHTFSLRTYTPRALPLSFISKSNEQSLDIDSVQETTESLGSIGITGVGVTSVSRAAAPDDSPLFQNVVTTTFDFSDGQQGWVIEDIGNPYVWGMWAASESCWYDSYEGTRCVGDYGLDPYQGVLINGYDPDHNVTYPYLIINYPRKVVAQGMELVWHRPTGSYWTPWQTVFYRVDGGDWTVLFQDDWPDPYTADWPDRDTAGYVRYQRLRLCFTEQFADCHYYYPGMDPKYHVPLTQAVEFRIRVYQHEQEEVFIDSVSFLNCVGCDGGASTIPDDQTLSKGECPFSACSIET